MTWKSIAIVIASGLFAASAAVGQMTAAPQAPGCDAGDKIDGVTLESAREKLNKAGFVQVTELKKACDNFWHSRAIKDGRPVNVALTPTGQAMIEGD